MPAEMNGYRAIFETLRKEVFDGKYDETTILPSEWALARRFGVCRPTVSRAILEMVNAGLVVRRQGAPTTITSFAKNASGTIGILTQGEWNYEDIYPSIVRGMGTFAERLGWRIIRCGLEPSYGRRRVKAIREVVERLCDNHVTGVFFQPLECVEESARFNLDIVRRMKKAGIHVVLLDYDIVPLPQRSTFDLVGVDNFAAGYAVGAHLHERGAKRVAYLCEPLAAPSVAERMRGLSAALHECGYKWWPPDNTITCRPDSEEGIAAFMGKSCPDAIVGYNDKAALTLARTLASLGHSIPGDVMLAGFDNIPSAAAANPPLTTMAQPVEDIVSVAFNTLVSRIKSPSLPPRKTLLSCQLMLRASTLRN